MSEEEGIAITEVSWLRGHDLRTHVGATLEAEVKRRETCRLYENNPGQFICKFVAGLCIAICETAQLQRM